MAKRNKLEIIRDILKIIQENHTIRSTPLLRRSNLSSTRFKRYYSDLLNKNFIREIYGDTKKITLTKKGGTYIEKYSTIVDFIDEFEL